MILKKGTILYFGSFEMPDKNAAAHRVLQNAKIFNSLGYDVVFSGIDKTIKNDSYEFSILEKYKSCPRKYPSSTLEWFSFLFSFKHMKFVLENVSDLKVVIAYNLHAFQLKKVISFCKKNNVKIIADITEWYENPFSFKPIKFIKFLDTNLVMKKIHKRVDAAIVISSKLFEYYSQFYVSNL